MRQYESYKDSGLQWLGKVPSHWKVQRTKYLWRESFEISENGKEQLLSVSQYDGITTNNNKSRSESLVGYKIVKADNLVINIMLAWMGGLGVSQHEGLVSPAYCVYKITGENNSRYFHYLYSTNKYLAEFARKSTGVIPSRWRMYTEDFGSVYSIIPQIEEQNAIVSYLDRVTADIDKAIEQQQRMIDLLNERKQIIIENAVTKGINPNVEFKDSGLEHIGKIPSSWAVTKLKRKVTLHGRIGFRGYTNADLVSEGEGAITLSPSNMVSGKMNYAKCSYLSWAKYFESPEIMVQNNDILFVKTGSTYGKSSLVENLPMETTINPQILLLKEYDIHMPFLAYLLQTQVILKQVEYFVIGSTIPTISQFAIGNIQFACPNRTEQIQIADYLNSIVEEIDTPIRKCNETISLLQERKRIIINDVVTGKIKVS